MASKAAWHEVLAAASLPVQSATEFDPTYLPLFFSSSSFFFFLLLLLLLLLIQK